MPYIFFKLKNVTAFYENACFSSGMKSETFTFARYFSVEFCIHMFLHNFGMLSSNLSDNILYLARFTFKLAKHKMSANI